MATTVQEIIVTLLAGSFVWGFGLMLRIKVRKVLMNLEVHK